MNQIPLRQARRTLQIQVLRHNPVDPASEPHLQAFEVEEADAMTLFIALNEIREQQDPSLQFDFVCRAGICGSCGMIINGRPGLACRTLTRDLPERITLAPLPAFYQREEQHLVSNHDFHKEDRQPAAPVDELDAEQGRKTVVDFDGGPVTHIDTGQVPFTQHAGNSHEA